MTACQWAMFTGVIVLPNLPLIVNVNNVSVHPPLRILCTFIIQHCSSLGADVVLVFGNPCSERS